MTIDDLKPGHKLDVLLHTKVMDEKAFSMVPHYSSDISDAFLLVDKLRESHFELTRIQPRKGDYLYRCCFNYRKVAYATQPTMAICKAALLAVGEYE